MKKSIVTSYHSIGFTHFEYLAFIKSNFISVMLVNNILIRMIINTFFIHESFCIWIDILSKTNQNINAAHRFILSVLTEKWDLRLREACPPRPVVHAPVPWLQPHVKTVPKGDAQKHETQRGKRYCKLKLLLQFFVFVCKTYFLERNVRYSQVVTPTRNSCSAFTHPKCTHTAVNTHTPWTHTRNSSSCNTSFSFVILYFCLQKAHYFFSILSFSLAKHYFLLQYFNSLANIRGIVLTPY